MRKNVATMQHARTRHKLVLKLHQQKLLLI